MLEAYDYDPPAILLDFFLVEKCNWDFYQIRRLPLWWKRQIAMCFDEKAKAIADWRERHKDDT